MVKLLKIQMARMNQLFYFLGFLLYFATCSGADQRWCVAKVGAPEAKMKGFLDFACGQLDCSGINPGGVCFEPNTLQNHASYALDLYYRARGQCNSEIGTISITDPSYGACHYP